MPYPRKLLNDGEDVILDLRPHWWFLFKPTATVLVLTAITLFGTLGLDLAPAFSWVSLAALLVATAWFIIRYVRWITTNFVVTTDRIVSRRGVIAKKGYDIPLERVNDITFNQTVFERIVGSGDLGIESGSGQGQQRFFDISKPSIVQNVIYREMERAAARDAERMAGARGLSIPEQIDKLDDLRQRGVISQAEFDAKKQQLLDRM